MENRKASYRITEGPLEKVDGDAAMALPAGETIRFQMPSGHWWYSHGFNHRQPYPLNREAISAQRFAVNNIQSPIWLCSAGFAILAQGQVARDVLLPSGAWRDVWTGEVYQQPLLTLHPAPCPGIPLFVRESNTALYESLHSIACGSVASGTTSSTYACGLDRDIKVTG